MLQSTKETKQGIMPAWPFLFQQHHSWRLWPSYMSWSVWRVLVHGEVFARTVALHLQFCVHAVVFKLAKRGNKGSYSLAMPFFRLPSCASAACTWRMPVRMTSHTRTEKGETETGPYGLYSTVRSQVNNISIVLSLSHLILIESCVAAGQYNFIRCIYIKASCSLLF
jgi:hypothetical protein